MPLGHPPRGLGNTAHGPAPSACWRADLELYKNCYWFFHIQMTEENPTKMLWDIEIQASVHVPKQFYGNTTRPVCFLLPVTACALEGQRSIILRETLQPSMSKLSLIWSFIEKLVSLALSPGAEQGLQPTALPPCLVNKIIKTWKKINTYRLLLCPRQDLSTPQVLVHLFLKSSRAGAFLLTGWIRILTLWMRKWGTEALQIVGGKSRIWTQAVPLQSLG